MRDYLPPAKKEIIKCYYNIYSSMCFILLLKNPMPDFLVPARIFGINSSADNCLILQENNTLTCVSTGVPQPTINWFIGDLNNTLMESSDKYTIRGDQLTINNVSYSDTNTSYGCTADNIAGEMFERDYIIESYPACSKY